MTLHLFWLIGKKPGALRYARLDELLRDGRLLDGLATAQALGREVLRDALERACRAGRAAAPDRAPRRRDRSSGT